MYICRENNWGRYFIPLRKRRGFHTLGQIKRCDAYVKYKNIKTKYLPIIKNCDNGDLWNYVYNIVTKEKLNIFRNKKEVLNQINSFKKRFIKKTESLVDRFWIKLCRTATLYYDEKENE